MNKKNKRASFTVIELLVVIAIIGLLASVILVSLTKSRGEAKEKAALQFSSNVYHALGADLVAFWSFDDSSNLGKDETGAHNGSVEGSVSSSENGIVRGAAEFSGGYIQVPDSDELDGAGLKNKATFEAWIKTTDNGDHYQRIFYKTGCYYFGIYNHKFNYTIRFVGTWFYTRCSANKPYPIEENKWYHYLVTYNGSEIKMYINGKEISECTQDTSGENIYSFGQDLRLGYSVTGLLDEVRIYKVPLTEAEVWRHYVEGAKKRGIAIEY